MNGLEKIKLNKKLVTIVIRSNRKTKEGLTFINSPKDIFQIGLHNYKGVKETKIHHNKIADHLVLICKNKFIYITKGSAKVELMLDPKKVDKIIDLKTGDSILIFDIFHKVIFSAGSSAIEIKQGPFGKINQL